MFGFQAPPHFAGEGGPLPPPGYFYVPPPPEAAMMHPALFMHPHHPPAMQVGLIPL